MTGSSGDPPRHGEGRQTPRNKRRRRRRRGRCGGGDTCANNSAAGAKTSVQSEIAPEGANAPVTQNVDAVDHASPHVSSPDSTGPAGKGKPRGKKRRRGRSPPISQADSSDTGQAANGQIAKRHHGTAESGTYQSPRDTSGPRRPPGRDKGQDQAKAKHRNRFHHGAKTAPNTYAALDLGTNNCRLLVARPSSHAFKVVDAFSRIVRLGEGLFHSGRLSEETMDRSLEALSVCRDKLVANGVNRYRLIATEACRKAMNGAQFLARVKSETGLDLEVVTRETEAKLAVSGCASLIDPRATGVVVFDIGGGSTELAVLDIRKRNGHTDPAISKRIIGWTSLPVGVVGIAERYGGEEVSPETFETIVEDVSAMLTDFHALGALDKHARRNVHLLGTSGTVTTIAGLHLGLARYDRRRVDGTWVGPASIRNVHQRLQAMSYEERAANACIGRERADLVLSGCAIFEAIRRRWPWARVRVADRGLREGILMTLMREDAVWGRPRDMRQ